MSWPVRYDVMAPTVPILSELEDALGNMESKVSEMVSHAVEKAVGAMKHSLAEMLHAGQDEIEAVVRRLERKITRATEHQEIMIYSMKSDLDQFQAEMRSTIRDLHTMQAQTPDKREGSTAQSESVDKGTPYNDRESYGSGGSGIWRGRKLDMPLFDGTDPDATAENLTSSSSDYKLSGRSVVAIENTGVKTPAVVPPTSNFQQDVNSQSTVSASPSGESASPIHTSWSNSRQQISNSFGNDTQLKIRESNKVDVKNTEKLEHVSSPSDNSTSAAVSASTASAFVSSTVPSENLNNGLFDSKPFSHSIPPNLPSSNSTEQVFGNSSTINHSLTSASMTSSSTSISSPSIFAVKPPSFPIVAATPPPSFSSEPVASLNFNFGASKTESSPAPTVSMVTGSGTTVETKSNEDTPITNKPPSGGGFAFDSAFALKTPIINKPPSGGAFAFGSAFALETPITNKPPSGGGFAFGSTFALETPITNKPPSGGGFAFSSAFATNSNAGNNPFEFCNSFASSSSNNQSQAFLPGFGSSSTVSSQSLPTTGASTATQSVPFHFGSSGSSTIFGTSGSSFTTNASVMGSSVSPANPFGSGTTVPTFGQPLVSQSPSAFNFGSAAPSIAASPFQFTPQNLPSFQTSNSLVNSGGSFSLEFGGGDEGNWEMVQISKNKNRRK